MINENKVSKYLLYAIGEIILVVIGILIALSINNWNEERKYRNLEIVTLIEIQKGLKQAKKENERSENANLETIKSYEILLDHIEKKLPYNESLNFHFSDLLSWQEPDFNYSGFELFKNRGSDLISNDSIRIKLLYIYEEKIQYLVNDHNKTEWNYNNTVMTPFFTNNFEIDIQNRMAIPNDHLELMSSQQFKNKLTYLIGIRRYGVKQSQELSLLIKNLISDILTETDKLRNEK
ncbi:MAG: hypothetical protein COB12_10250 [Flavobacterium sp.]|nr:MAG: hypothetical protein COB12_10250 [Flavobacterium sp.]